MLISSAYAFDAGKVGTGSSGGGIALLINPASGILLFLLNSAGGKWRGRKLERAGDPERGARDGKRRGLHLIPTCGEMSPYHRRLA